MQVRPRLQTNSHSKEPSDLCADEIMEVIPQIARYLGHEMRRKGPIAVSMPQLKVLNFISRNPGTSVSHAADDLGVTKASASDLIDRLVKKGYIGRVDDPGERRKVLLTLTSEGKGFLIQVKGNARTSAASILSKVSSAKLAKVVDGLQVLKEAFKEV
jgi:DNA-binding MarR family transcriptional regulator